MKPTILLTTIAASAALFTQPLQAKPDNKGKGDGHPAPAQAAPPAAHAQAPHGQAMHAQAMHAPAMHMQSHPQPMRGPAQSQIAHAQPQRVAPQQFNNQQHVGTGAAIANNRSIQNNHRGPTVALGGSNNNVNSNNWRANNNVNNNRVQSFSRTTNNFRPPSNVYRGWEHDRVHTWNHRSYRWYNNDWIVIDGGYGYPGYGYDYDTPYTYDNSYAPPTVDYGTNLTSEVQEELSRRGYSTGGVDGVIGPQTRNAIAGFQEDNGLPVTGRIDTRLVRSLGL